MLLIHIHPRARRLWPRVLNDLLKSPLISLQNGISVEKVLPSIVTRKTKDDYN